VELHQLSCFVAVAEEGGFNRASHRLRITQPAVSYQVKQLESELECALFLRGPRGVTTTHAGRVLLNHAHRIFEAVRRAEHAIERLTEGVAGDVRIGTVNSVGMYVFPAVLRSMRAQFSKVHMTILYRNYEEVMDALHTNQVEFAVVANPAPDRSYVTETLLEEPVSLVCGRAHPLFGRTEVGVDALRHTDFVALTDDSPTGQLCRDYMHSLGLQAEPVVLTENVETVKRMVEIGLGVALLPNMTTAEEISCAMRLAGRLARIKISPKLTRRIALVRWQDADLSPAANAFIDLLRGRCRTWCDCNIGLHGERCRTWVDCQERQAGLVGE
jgi:DNA-binding transcriptional LysR family regulator